MRQNARLGNRAFVGLNRGCGVGVLQDHKSLDAGPAREPRRARLARGVLRLSGGREVQIVVRNMSRHGLGLSSHAGPPMTGEAVTVSLPGHDDLHGVVRWVRNHNFGVELTTSVNPENLALSLQREIARAKEAADWQVSRLHRITSAPAAAPRRAV